VLCKENSTGYKVEELYDEYYSFLLFTGSQPWAAAIRLQGSQRSFHWCGAVLVSEFYVLTVAHCMEDYPKDVYRVRIGDWDMQVGAYKPKIRRKKH